MSELGRVNGTSVGKRQFIARVAVFLLLAAWGPIAWAGPISPVSQARSVSSIGESAIVAADFSDFTASLPGASQTSHIDSSQLKAVGGAGSYGGSTGNVKFEIPPTPGYSGSTSFAVTFDLDEASKLLVEVSLYTSGYEMPPASIGFGLVDSTNALIVGNWIGSSNQSFDNTYTVYLPAGQYSLYAGASTSIGAPAFGSFPGTFSSGSFSIDLTATPVGTKRRPLAAFCGTDLWRQTRLPHGRDLRPRSVGKSRRCSMDNSPVRLPAEAIKIKDEIVKLLNCLDGGIRLAEAVSLQQLFDEMSDQLIFSGVERKTVLANLPNTADEAVTASQLYDDLFGMVTLETIRFVCNERAELIEKRKQATRYWLPVAVLV